MRKVNYVFKFYDLDTQTFYTLKNDIDEWQSFGISYGREKEKTTFVKSYVANFTFVKEDAAWLRNMIFTRGFNIRIAIYVYSADMFGTLTTQYRGFLDLTNAEITSVFKCPIYSGGFFNSLDNCWTTQYDLSPSEIKGIFNFEFTKFKDYIFNGGSYLYDERFTLCNGTENCITEIPVGISEAVFLPFKPSFRTANDEIGYSNKNVTQSLVSTLNDTSDTNVNCCFITSTNKANIGTMKFNLLNVGTLKIRDLDLILGSNYSNVAKIGYRITLQIVIYDEVRDETWNFWKHLLIETNYPVLLNDNPIIQRQDIKACTIVSDSETPGRKNAVISGVELTGNDFYYDSAISDYYDFSFLKDDNAKRGYRIGICLTNIENVKYYDSSNVQVLAGSGADPSSARTPEFTFNENFSIDVVINKFTLNRNKKIHGVTAEDVFIDLIKNINTKQYNIDIDTSLLTNKVGNVVLFSDLGLLGSTLDLNENNIASVIKTSISDFLDTIYKVWGLQMYCRYDIVLNKYFISFVELANTMQSVKIDTLTNIASLTITPARDLMSTELAVGYEIAEDSFFGRYEFNCKNTFKTTNSESEVILKDYVSKYNASVFDIETYIYKMNGNFKDSKGNGKVFLISMNETENIIYEINDGKINNTINVLLRPSANLSRHYSELAGMTYFNRVLTFISSTMNGNFVYGGRAENDNVTILEAPYFIPFEATIEVPAVTDLIPKIEDNPLGYFEFTYNDKTYKGYIAEGTESLTINPMNEQPSTLRLLLTNDSAL